MPAPTLQQLYFFAAIIAGLGFHNMVQRYDWLMCRCLQVTLAEYLADLMPASFKGNETAAEIEASPVWKDSAHEWIVANKVLCLRVEGSWHACTLSGRADALVVCRNNSGHAAAYGDDDYQARVTRIHKESQFLCNGFYWPPTDFNM
jgi:hypothetical protein